MSDPKGGGGIENVTYADRKLEEGGGVISAYLMSANIKSKRSCFCLLLRKRSHFCVIVKILVNAHIFLGPHNCRLL